MKTHFLTIDSLLNTRNKHGKQPSQNLKKNFELPVYDLLFLKIGAYDVTLYSCNLIQISGITELSSQVK